jgi:hypothetical protein
MKLSAPAALLAGALIWTGVAAAAQAVPAPADREVLEAAPVDALPPAPTPAPEPAAEAAPAASTPAETSVPYDFARPRLLLPYYLCAYVPPPDRTELNLGLLLSQAPGIDVALGWGAMERMEIAAHVAAFGASNTVDLGLKYLFLPEQPESTKPALALLIQALFLNHRTLGEIRENIFRGNRLQAGIILSKDLGLLARNLNAGQGLQAFFSALRLHGEVVLEYQTGLSGAAEEPVSRIDAGAKLALEAALQPEILYMYAVMDSIPDWIGDLNYYLGARYYSQPDLAFDALAGRIQNNLGLALAISWIF